MSPKKAESKKNRLDLITVTLSHTEQIDRQKSVKSPLPSSFPLALPPLHWEAALIGSPEWEVVELLANNVTVELNRIDFYCHSDMHNAIKKSARQSVHYTKRNIGSATTDT